MSHSIESDRKAQIETQIEESSNSRPESVESSPSVAISKIIKLSETVVFKTGHHASPFEAKTLRFLAANSKVPVPKVFSSFECSDTSSITMEFIPGTSLKDALPGLSLSEKSEVERQLREAVVELRSLPSPGYIGSIDRNYCADSTFWTAARHPALSGPFESIENMIQDLLHRLTTLDVCVVELIRRWMLADLTRNRKIVFTHCDLRPENVMVTKSTDADGRGRIYIRIINWEKAGWYPEYWEYYTAERSARTMLNDGDCECDWWNMMTRIVPVYRLEQGLLQRYSGLAQMTGANISPFEQQCQL